MSYNECIGGDMGRWVATTWGNSAVVSDAFETCLALGLVKSGSQLRTHFKVLVVAGMFRLDTGMNCGEFSKGLKMAQDNLSFVWQHFNSP